MFLNWLQANLEKLLQSGNDFEFWCLLESEVLIGQEWPFLIACCHRFARLFTAIFPTWPQMPKFLTTISAGLQV